MMARTRSGANTAASVKRSYKVRCIAADARQDTVVITASCAEHHAAASSVTVALSVLLRGKTASVRSGGGEARTAHFRQTTQVSLSRKSIKKKCLSRK